MVGMVEKEWENIELKIPMITIYGGNGREGMGEHRVEDTYDNYLWWEW